MRYQRLLSINVSLDALRTWDIHPKFTWAVAGEENLVDLREPGILGDRRTVVRLANEEPPFIRAGPADVHVRAAEAE